MGDILGPGFFNKPRYRYEVLIGNWYEERALKDPSFLPSSMTSRKPVSVDSVVKDEVRLSSATNMGVTVNGGQSKEALGRSSGGTEANKEEMNNNTKDFSVNPGDPIRGYYATTYKRSYGPRNGYIHADTYPSAMEDFDTRREAAMHPENMDSTAQETMMDNNNTSSNCLRCEQLAKSSKENSDCPRCVQLAGL